MSEVNQYRRIIYVSEMLLKANMELIKSILTRNGWNDLSAPQAFLLFCIGKAELTATDIRSRALCHIANLSYVVSELYSRDYIEKNIHTSDRRITLIRLTSKGMEVAEAIVELYTHHLGSGNDADRFGLSVSELVQLNNMMSRLQQGVMEATNNQHAKQD